MEDVGPVQGPPHRRQVRPDRVLEEHQDDQREAHRLDEFRLTGIECHKACLCFDFSGRYAHHGHAGRQDVLHDDRAGSDADAVRDADAAEDLRVLSDVDVVADDGGVVGIAAVAADAAVAVDDAVPSNPGLGIDDHGSVMLQVQVFTEAACADDEAQSRTQTVLAASIPEAEEFVRRGEGVLLFFTKEAQIPLDVVHLRTDPPFHEFFLECHDCAVNFRAQKKPLS